LNTVDEALCIGCENCKQVCQFEALSLDSLGLMQVNALRCVGCGVCITVCEQDAMRLQRRPPEEIISIPATEHDWRSQRAQARGLDLDLVL
jgi:heterodisulfide reductase subunit A-like polyferredoxin